MNDGSQLLAHRRLWIALGYALAVAVVVSSLVPGGERLNVGGADKLVHAGAYLVLMVWFAGLQPRRAWTWVAFALLGDGARARVCAGRDAHASRGRCARHARQRGRRRFRCDAGRGRRGDLAVQVGDVARAEVRPEAASDGRPLADRMRPASLDEFVGQSHLLAPGKPLRRLIEGRAFIR